MTAYRDFVDAAEHFERLFWAHKAQVAFSKKATRVTDESDVRPGDKVICRYEGTGRVLIRYTPTTLPSLEERAMGRKTRMGDWERRCLEHQRDAVGAPSPQQRKAHVD